MLRHLLPITLLLCFSPACLAQDSAAQTSDVAPSPAAEAPALETRHTVAKEYIIGEGDVLQVSVWREPKLGGTVIVRPDGKVSLPLIDEVVVSGFTALSVQEAVRNKYAQLVRNPKVTVEVAEVHNKLIYITGKVEHPGAFPLDSPTNVLQLIARAGGVVRNAKLKDIYVLRQGSSKRFPVDYKSIVKGHHESENIQLQVGDTVVVP